MRTTLEKILSKVDFESPGSCWPWTGQLFVNGYGRLRPHLRAHRVSYELFVGPIPAGMDLDHLCRVRRCVNPDHLEPVTRRENLARGAGFIGQQLRKTTCLRGHPLAGTNLIPSKTGRRQCRECHNLRRRR